MRKLRGIRATWRWFAVILPHDYIVATVLVGMIGISLFADVVRAVPPGQGDPIEMMMYICAISWGFVRAFSLNPVFDSEYRDWLASTPWRRGMPLPFGSVLPALQDLVALLLLFGWSVAVRLDHPGLTVGAYVLGWCFAACLAMLVSRETTGFAAAFLLPGLLLVWNAPLLISALLTAATAAASIGLWRSLGRFPWKDGLTPEERAAQNRRAAPDPSDRQGAAKLQRLGWPFARLGPPERRAEALATGAEKRLSLDAALGCLLVVWMFRCIAGTPAPNPQGREAVLLTTYLGLSIACVGLRTALMLYCQPPLNLWGQIASFRPIIPSYHSMLLNPVGTAIIAVLGPLLLNRAGLSLENNLSLSAVAVLLSQAVLGPELHRWRLTCAQRAPEPFQFGSSEILVRVK